MGVSVAAAISLIPGNRRWDETKGFVAFRHSGPEK
jgi:hypothetical protein